LVTGGCGFIGATLFGIFATLQAGVGEQCRVLTYAGNLANQQIAQEHGERYEFLKRYRHADQMDALMTEHSFFMPSSILRRIPRRPQHQRSLNFIHTTSSDEHSTRLRPRHGVQRFIQSRPTKSMGR